MRRESGCSGHSHGVGYRHGPIAGWPIPAVPRIPSRHLSADGWSLTADRSALSLRHWSLPTEVQNRPSRKKPIFRGAPPCYPHEGLDGDTARPHGRTPDVDHPSRRVSIELMSRWFQEPDNEPDSPANLILTHCQPREPQRFSIRQGPRPILHARRNRANCETNPTSSQTSPNAHSRISAPCGVPTPPRTAASAPNGPNVKMENSRRRRQSSSAPSR
jgi:hypothetical protein